MGLLDDIKNQVKKSGSNKSKFIYFKDGVKVRVRFLVDIEDGMKVLFHDSYARGINVPCQELFDKTCPHCEDDELRHRDQYIWPVWDYEAKEVKLLMAAVNNCSPVPTLVAMFDTYGTLTDRDYVITKSGKGQSSSFSVVPMDKAKFRNDKAKPFSESKILSLLDKAYPAEVDEDEDEEKPKKKGKGKGKRVVEDDDDEDETPKKKKGKKPVDEDDATDYEDMSAKELYALCKERGIKVKQKMDEEYYITKLEEVDEEEDDEEDEW